MAYGEFFECEICGKEVKRKMGWSLAAMERGNIPEGWDSIHGIGWICDTCITNAFGPRDKDKGPGVQARTLPDTKLGDQNWTEE